VIKDKLEGYLSDYLSEAGLGEGEKSLLEEFVEYVGSEVDSFEAITRGMVSSEFYHYYFDYSEDSDYKPSRKEKRFSMLVIKNFLVYLKEVHSIELDTLIQHLEKRLME
jgi:hypothetical protein